MPVAHHKSVQHTMPAHGLGQIKLGAVGEVMCLTFYIICIGLAGGKNHSRQYQSDNFYTLHFTLFTSHDVQVTDALIVNDAADGLGKHIGHGELLNLGTALRVRNGVGKDYLLKG